MHPRTLAIGLLSLACLASATAQSSDARATRERELLRRAQATLQQTSAERDALQAEKAQLTAERDRLKAQGERDASDLRAVRGESARYKAELDRVRAALADARRDASALAQAGNEREAALQGQLAAAQRDLAARTLANQQLAALLARATAALQSAEERNAALHALSHQMVDRWLAKSTTDTLLQREPLFGLREVAMQDTAEALRARIDALQMPPRQP